MKPLNYCANTPQKIAALAACTPDDVQQYLQLCLEISATQAARNVLAFPYDFSVNPYAVFYHWLEQAKFQIHPEFSAEEISQLRHLAKLSVKEFRSQKVDSRQLFQSNPPSTNPFLLNFSQIYALHLVLDGLHVYNFYLENYIHESHRLRAAIRNDQQRSENSPLQHWHRKFARHSTAGSNYNFYVRSILLHEAVDDGLTPFMHQMHYSYERPFRPCHPVLKPANRINAIEAFLENQKLAKKLKRYRYYHFLQPTAAEQKFFHELRNEHGDFTHQELLTAGSEKLYTAVELDGKLSQHVATILQHHAV